MINIYIFAWDSLFQHTQKDEIISDFQDAGLEECQQKVGFGSFVLRIETKMTNLIQYCYKDCRNNPKTKMRVQKG